jgi:dTDP-4-dehydrorhamnose reductase
MKNKIYIAGCGGMLGEAFYKQFINSNILKCTDIDINEDWLSFLDFRNYNDYENDVLEFSPNWLFHLGAFTDLEYCELNSVETYRTNTESVQNAVKISNKLKIPLLYISTAGIFNGKKESYDDFDNPDPICHYAKSKFLGEKFVQDHSKNYLICRAGWMMGGGPKKDKKFVEKIMKQLKAGSKELYIVNDKLGTPTYTQDFAKNVKLLIDNNQRGLFNMVCDGLTGRLEVANELLSLLSLDDKVKINVVSSDYFKESYFADRPDCERLINKKLNDLDLNIMRDWKIALKEYINNYYKDYLTE